MTRLPSPPGRSRRPLWYFIGAAVAAVLVTACGGGGGGGGSSPPPPPDAVTGPPTSPATLAATTAEAAGVAQAAVGGAELVANRSSALSGLSALFGQPIGAQATPSAALTLPLALRAGRAQPLAVTVETCDTLFDPPCSGTATVDTDIADTATQVTAGQYVDVRFNAMTGSSFGQTLAINGRMRIDFLSGLNLDAPQLQNVQMRVRLDALTVTVNGATVGPISDLADLVIDANGNFSLVAAGARYSALDGVAVTGAGTYTIGSGVVRTAYGSGGGYADVNLQNWRSNAGRPVVGSTATLSAGTNRATVTVTSSTTATVTYSVVLTVGGSSSVYTVTASYPAGGGAPTYTAAPAN